MDFTFNDAIDETHESGEMGHYIYTYAEDGSTAMIALLINNSDVDAVGRDCDVVNVDLSGLFSIGKTVTLPCGVTVDGVMTANDVLELWSSFDGVELDDKYAFMNMNFVRWTIEDG